MAEHAGPPRRRAIWTWLEAGLWVLAATFAVVAAGRPFDEWGAVREPRVVQARVEPDADAAEGWVWVRVGETGRRTEVDLTGSSLAVEPGGTLLVRDHGDTTIPADVTMSSFLRADLPPFAVATLLFGGPAWWLRRRRRRHPANQVLHVGSGDGAITVVPLATWPIQRRAVLRVRAGHVEVGAPSLWGGAELQVPLGQSSVSRCASTAERRRALADVDGGLGEVLARPVVLVTPVSTRRAPRAGLRAPQAAAARGRSRSARRPRPRSTAWPCASPTWTRPSGRSSAPGSLACRTSGRGRCASPASSPIPASATRSGREARRRARTRYLVGTVGTVGGLSLARATLVWHLSAWTFVVAAAIGGTGWWALRGLAKRGDGR